MTHTCTKFTDLDELIGSEFWEGHRLIFSYGPLPRAMKGGEELVLNNSKELSAFMLAKVSMMLDSMFIDDTDELIHSL